jgi:hypothetical protein
LEKLGTHLGLERIYQKDPLNPDPKAETEPGNAAPGRFVTPPHAEVLALYELAMMGDVYGIEKQLEQLEKRGTHFSPFFTRIRELAEEYDMKQIRDLIKPYLEQEP